MEKSAFFIFKKFLLLTLFCFAPYAVAEVAEVKLLVPMDGEITSLVSQERTPLTKDKENNIKINGPSILSLSGRMPVLLIPAKEKGSEVKLDPPTFKEAAAKNGQLEVSLIASEIMIAIQNIQRDIQKKKYDSAFIQVQELQTKYPNVGFLDFLRGSILFLQGKRGAAREAVNKALEMHPNFEQGKEFLKQIGGSVDDKAGE
ncbi:MAG: hypothetical protein ACLGGX_03155 [Bdellovibrionia bacterium]